MAGDTSINYIVHTSVSCNRIAKFLVFVVLGTSSDAMVELVQDLAWLSKHIGRTVTSSVLDDADLDKLNKTCFMRWLTVTFEDGDATRLVLKASVGDQRAKEMGLAREADFYKSWAKLDVIQGASCKLGAVFAM